MDTFKCKCGNEADFVAGMEVFDSIFKQYYCNKCKKAFITRNNNYIREGILAEPPLEDTPRGIYDDDDY